MSALPAQNLSRIRLLRELGSGATGTVQEAELLRPLAHLPVGTRVAVKFLHQKLTEDPAARKRFLREAKAGLSVRHPNLLRVHAVEEVNLLGQKLLYLIMEYVEGKNLRLLMREAGALGEGLVRNVGAQIAAGLSALHEKGIVHLDVKPENVVLTNDRRVVLMDLGFARQIHSQSDTEDRSTFVGSVAYAAPERIRSHGALSPQSDLYSLGVLLYEISTGRLPFHSDDLSQLLHSHLEETPHPPSTLNPRVSPFLETLILNLLQKKPSSRIHGAEELAEILSQGEGSSWWRERIQERRAAPSFHLKHMLVFRGREPELGELEKIWAQCRRGELQTIELAGESGMGKSRFVDEFVSALQEKPNPPLALYGRSPRAEEPPPGAPFLSALERYLGLPKGSRPKPAELKKLKALLPPAAAQMLFEALSGEVKESEGYEQTLAQHFASFIEALALEGAMVLFLDDFSWADHTTLSIVDILRGKKQLPLCLILAIRPDVEIQGPSEWIERARSSESFHRLTLTRLSRQAVREILGNFFTPGVNVEEWCSVLEERSGGNPSLLVEIIKTLQTRGDFIQKERGWESRVSPRGVPIPVSVADAIRERCNLLDPQDRALLQCAAVAGVRFDTKLLASAFEMDHLELLQGINRLERQYGLVVSAGPYFRFARPAVREILYKDLDSEVRSQAHRRLAKAIESSTAGKPMTPREAISYVVHSSQGGDPQNTLRVLIPLLEWMHRRSLFENVHHLAHLGITQMNSLPNQPQQQRRRFDLLKRAAEAEGRLGLREQEKKDLEECAKIASALKDEARLSETYYLLGRFAHTTGKYLTALGFLEKAEEHAQKGKSPRLQAEALLQRATVLSYLGDLGSAEQLFQKSVKKSTELGIALRAFLGLAKLRTDQGRLDSANEALHQAETLQKKTKDPTLLTLFFLFRGRALASVGRDGAAALDLQRGANIAQHTGDRRLHCLILSELGTVLFEKDEKNKAQECLRKAAAMAEQTADRYALALSYLSLAEWLLEEGHPYSEVRRYLRPALNAAEEADLYELSIRGKFLMSRIHYREGKNEEAYQVADSAHRAIRDHQLPILPRIFLYFRYFGILQALGKEREAIETLERCARLVHAVSNLTKSSKIRESWREQRTVRTLINASARLGV